MDDSAMARSLKEAMEAPEVEVLAFSLSITLNFIFVSKLFILKLQFSLLSEIVIFAPCVFFSSILYLFLIYIFIGSAPCPHVALTRALGLPWGLYDRLSIAQCRTAQ